MAQIIDRPFISKAETKRICKDLAKAYENLVGGQWLRSDMELSLKQWERENTDEAGKIHGDFWLAIRRQGVEAGKKDYVKERCNTLGAPLCVIKLEGGGGKFINLKAKF